MCGGNHPHRRMKCSCGCRNCSWLRPESAGGFLSVPNLCHRGRGRCRWAAARSTAACCLLWRRHRQSSCFHRWLGTCCLCAAAGRGFPLCSIQVRGFARTQPPSIPPDCSRCTAYPTAAGRNARRLCRAAGGCGLGSWLRFQSCLRPI